MKKLVYILVTTIIFFSCEDKSSHEGHDHGHEHGHESENHDENGVTITQNQADNLNIILGTFSKIKLSEVIETNGQLELAPQNFADVHVLMEGVITKINVIEGNKVKKGQVLAILQHPDIIKFQEDLISKNAELSYLKSEYNRQEKLYTEKVGAGKDFDKIKSEYFSAKAIVEALKVKVRMIGLSPKQIIAGNIRQSIYVVSPLAGTVSHVETNIGEYVSTNKRLFGIVDNQKLHCSFKVYENDVFKVKEGDQIEVTSPSMNGKTFTATIYSISPVFNENPKSVMVQASFKNVEQTLISGMYVTGKIQTDSLTRTVIPRTAVITDDEKKYVFVSQKKETTKQDHEAHNHEGHDHSENDHSKHDHPEEHEEELSFKKVEVKIGIEEENWVEILNTSDFDSNDAIALTSAYYLQAEIGKGETEHVH